MMDDAWTSGISLLLPCVKYVNPSDYISPCKSAAPRYSASIEKATQRKEGTCGVAKAELKKVFSCPLFLALR
jgi:hypothetical protein